MEDAITVKDLAFYAQAKQSAPFAIKWDGALLTVTLVMEAI